MEKWYEDKTNIRKGLILCDLEYNYQVLQDPNINETMRNSVLNKINLEESILKIIGRFRIYKDKETDMWYYYGSEPSEVSMRNSENDKEFDSRALVNYNLSRCIDEIMDNRLFDEINNVEKLIRSGKEFKTYEMEKYSAPIRNYIWNWRDKDISTLNFVLSGVRRKLQ